MIALKTMPESDAARLSSLDVSQLILPRTSQQRLSDAINQPAIQKLVGEVWMSNELHLLFADTGVGKSILAVAIGDALSKGKNVLFLKNECRPLTVLYYDFELSDRQFLNRYSSESGGGFGFSNHFYVDTINFADLFNIGGENSFEKTLFRKIRHDVETLKADVLIIDNITYLKTQTTQKTDSALELMRELTDLKREFNLSILVLAHTPKIDQSSPLTINSLAGSKHLSNFADSVSAIGKSTLGPNIRYIKQVKPSRSAEMVYDTNNVITCQISKTDNFLTFDHTGFDNEMIHLKQQDRDDKVGEAQRLLNEGKSYSQIAEAVLGDPSKKGTIHKWLQSKPGTTVSSVSSVSNSEYGNGGNDGNGNEVPF